MEEAATERTGNITTKCSLEIKMYSLCETSVLWHILGKKSKTRCNKEFQNKQLDSDTIVSKKNFLLKALNDFLKSSHSMLQTKKKLLTDNFIYPQTRQF